MLKLENKLNIIARKSTYVSEKHEGDKLIAFEKDELVFVFNFHPSKVIYIIYFIYLIYFKYKYI